MKRSRFFLFSIALAVLGVLYFLPRHAKKAEALSGGSLGHAYESLWEEKKPTLAAWKDQLKKIPPKTKVYVQLTDSIARTYFRVSVMDSAIYYADRLYSLGAKKEAARIYYKIQEQLPDNKTKQTYQQKTKTLIKELMNTYPREEEWKIKEALLLVSSARPMDGVRKLKDMLKENPLSEEINFQLGKLSVLSGQYDKAIQYLSQVATSSHTKSTEAMLYLGKAWMEKGNEKKSLYWFGELRKVEVDPAILDLCDRFMETLSGRRLEEYEYPSL
ncbi:MAG: hypothetical protein OXB93_06100 [Cytophagales bacterium]|nr:hypothetical protein [Cytophagales bacterium]